MHLASMLHVCHLDATCCSIASMVSDLGRSAAWGGRKRCGRTGHQRPSGRLPAGIHHG